ncbi:MAG: hypothetical protein KW788_04445 [Candidatus Doudnabacteria bacterium]|nr:hypothetical protein [Candidatus Doudnabacteria bacterium]
MFFPSVIGVPEGGYKLTPNGQGGYSVDNAYDGPVAFFEGNVLGYYQDGKYYPVVYVELIEAKKTRAIP